MNIDNELENMNITTWKDADEATQDAMLKVLTESDNGEMVMCDNMTCETIITESGSYYEDTLKSFLVEMEIIYDEDDYDEDDVSVEITGIKFSDVVLYTNEVEDSDYNSETEEIIKLGTFTTQHTLYCSGGCAKREYWSFLMMKARYEAKE